MRAIAQLSQGNSPEPHAAEITFVSFITRILLSLTRVGCVLSCFPLRQKKGEVKVAPRVSLNPPLP